MKCIETVIKCDGRSKDCEKRIFNEPTEHSSAYQRREGAMRGWVYLHIQHKDYCPVCYRERRRIVK